MRSFCIILLALILFSCAKQEQTAIETTSADPLPSWNEGATKSAILEYVSRVTTAGNPDFIPVVDRIATFDNDGTLWAERPYVQELFASYRVKKMVEKNPKLAKKQPFKAVIEGDKSAFANVGDRFILDLLQVTHTGLSEDEFDESVREFYATAVFPKWNVPLKQIRFQPQLELLDFLRANDFKVYICTGGTIEFVRAISQEYYGVPEDQVIGSFFKYVFVDSTRKIYRQPAFNFNDKAEKPASIQLFIGKHPVLACGNDGGKGDIQMLAFSQAGKYKSLQLLVNHDDEARESFYGEPDSASLKAAAKNSWHVISVKNDWKEVFPKPR